MKQRLLYLAGMLFVILLGLQPGCMSKFNQLEEPKLNLVGFKLIEAQLLEQRYALTFRLINPNDVVLPITGIYYEVELEGNAFATGVNASPVEVPAYGETRVTVEMSTTLLQSMRHLAAIAEAKSETLDFRLKGHLNVKLPMLGKIPFSEAGQIKLGR